MASRRPPTDSTRTTPAVTPPTPAPVSDVADSKTAVKAKAAAKPRAPRKKAATPTLTVSGVTIEISEDVRRGMIAEAAYLRAERRGFSGGHDKEREDWLAAEAEVDALLKGGHGTSPQ